MVNRTALLMRAISDELSGRIVPELRSADAIERANLARLILRDLAADLDVLPDVVTDLGPALRSELAGALAQLPTAEFASELPVWRGALTKIASSHDGDPQREIGAWRTLAATVMRELSDRVRTGASSAAQAAADSTLRRLAAIDGRWLTAYAAAMAKSATVSTAPPVAAEATASTAEPTVATVTAYLRRAFPGEKQIAASEVLQIPGGRSKKTFFVSIGGSSSLPPRAVIRQDYALKYEGTKVCDEFNPLVKLAEKGLPVPRPWHLEPAESEVGPPFMIMERLQGSAPGTYFGLNTPCPGAFRDMARTLAVLHCMPPQELGFTAVAAPANSLEAIVDRFERKWRDNATRPSPLIDYAYAWARSEARREPAPAVVVHGDAGPYNFLIADDRLTAVLDWEFAHLGDPAEDLGIVRVYAENTIDWQEFLDLYAAAGGPPVAEHRVRLSMVLQFLKGTTLVAASGRNFEEGWTREFVKGASSFTGLRLIEQRIAALLERFGAL